MFTTWWRTIAEPSGPGTPLAGSIRALRHSPVSRSPGAVPPTRTCLVCKECLKTVPDFFGSGSAGEKAVSPRARTGKLTPFDIGGDLPPNAEIAITSMYREPAGIFWLGGSHGLFRFDPSNGASIHYPQHRPNGLPTDIRGITQDNAGNLWLATTDDAVNFFNPNTGDFARRWPTPKSQSIASSSSIFAGPDGVLWRGTSRGLELFDPSTGAFAVLGHNAADRHSLSGNEILSLATDREGSVWVGTKEGGVNRFSPSSLRFGAWRRNPADKRSLSDENVRAIYADRAGVLWLGTYNGGLNRYDAASGTFTHFRHDPANPASLDDDRVYSIYEDRTGYLWVGTGVGINRLDRKSGEFAHFKRGEIDKRDSSIPTYWFLEDRRQVFWFGAGTVKATLDRRTGAVTSNSFLACPCSRTMMAICGSARRVA